MTEVAGPSAPPWVARYDPTVPAHVEIPERTLPAVVEESVRRWPNRPAFIFYGSRLSYARFWDASARFASALHRDGVRPGDRVALYLPNCPAYPVALYGALRLGAIVVQVNPLYLGQDLSRILLDARPKALVTLEVLHPNLARVHAEFAPELVYVARLREFYPPFARLFVNTVLRRRKMPTEFPRGESIRPWHDALRPPPHFPEATPDVRRDPALFQYTGGTTGIPKAAMLSHRNLVANALQCRSWFNTLPPGTSVVLASIPFFHIYGLTVALNYPLIEGATIVLQLRPEPDEILKLIAKYRPTEFPGVPSLYQAINHHPRVREYDLRSIRVCVSGSTALPREVAQQFEALTGCHLIEGYGLSEASPVTHATPIVGERRLGSIGLPLPDTDQRVVDADGANRTLGPGEVGELAVRGPQVMLGYYGQPEETAGVLRDGWLFTGDIAYIDADGYAFIVDRKKDMINVGGLKVYPREVEEVLFQHPHVRDVSAVGVPDERLGEVVHAVVVPKPGTQPTGAELIAFVRERIAHYKAPRSVEFRSELPRSGIQKVLRRTLRAEAGARAAAPPTDPGPTGPGQSPAAGSR